MGFYSALTANLVFVAPRTVTIQDMRLGGMYYCAAIGILAFVLFNMFSKYEYYLTDGAGHVVNSWGSSFYGGDYFFSSEVDSNGVAIERLDYDADGNVCVGESCKRITDFVSAREAVRSLDTSARAEGREGQGYCSSTSAEANPYVFKYDDEFTYGPYECDFVSGQELWSKRIGGGVFFRTYTQLTTERTFVPPPGGAASSSAECAAHFRTMNITEACEGSLNAAGACSCTMSACPPPRRAATAPFEHHSASRPPSKVTRLCPSPRAEGANVAVRRRPK